MKCFLILMVFFATSCAKEKSCENCLDNNTYKNATIVYEGPVATDGCGWLVKLDDTHIYQPDVLNTVFQHDQLSITIAFELTSAKFTCGISGLQIPIIHVLEIKL